MEISMARHWTCSDGMDILPWLSQLYRVVKKLNATIQTIFVKRSTLQEMKKKNIKY